MGTLPEYHGRPVSSSEIPDPDSIQLEKHKLALAATMSDEAMKERLERIERSRIAFEITTPSKDTTSAEG